MALWSANNGIKAIFEALNVAYSKNERRSFLKLNVVSFAFTLSGLLFGIILIAALGIIPRLLTLIGLDGWNALLVSVARWPLTAAVVAGAISIIYRFGPDRQHAKWRWLSWGGISCNIRLDNCVCRLHVLLANFADYKCRVRSAWCSRWPDGMDVDFGDSPHPRRRTERGTGTSNCGSIPRPGIRFRWENAEQ